MLMSLFVAPALTFGFIVAMKKLKADVEKLKYRKEILELEIKKEEMHVRLIEAENRKYDKMIESDMKPQGQSPE